MIAKLEYLDIFEERARRRRDQRPSPWTPPSSSTPTPRSPSGSTTPSTSASPAGPQGNRVHPLGRRARHAARQRRRRHHPHLLRLRPRLRGRGRARAALEPRAALRGIGAELIACPTRAHRCSTCFTLTRTCAQLADRRRVPMKVAVMGCVVNGPGEAEGADVAVFAGDRKGIIYVRGERVATVPEEDILDRLLDECRSFQTHQSGTAKLGEVDIVPARPDRRAGLGWEKMAAEHLAGHRP
ncbi:MAG: flavodoxin-dependent (E)-4-hydroxy-3-methylbut-2-enyl-diphosphate synthase [Phycisphaerales bacterium]